MANLKFWLSPRKDYIFENFERLTAYLRDCSYDVETKNADFDDTLECMLQLVDDITKSLYSSPFYSRPNLDNYPEDDVIRLLISTILACRKSGREMHRPLSLLCVLICRTTKNLDYDTLSSLFTIITQCNRKTPIATLSFGWADVATKGVNIPGLAMKLKSITFKEEINNVVRYMENKGCIVIPPNETPKLFNGSFADFCKLNLHDTLSLPDLITLQTDSDPKLKTMDFAEEYDYTTRLLRSLMPLKHKTEINEDTRHYDLYDKFIVRVVEKRSALIIAETVDTRYHSIKGKVNLNLGDQRPNFFNISEEIHPGDYLRVMLSESNSFAFEIYDTFEDFYREFAADCYGQVHNAVYQRDYAKGTQWITEYGVRVGIENADQRDVLPEEDRAWFDECIENRLPIQLKFYSNRPRTDLEVFNMYAMPLVESWNREAAENVIPEIADANLFLTFLEDCKEMAEKIIKQNLTHISIKELSEEECAQYLPVIYRMLDTSLPSSKARLEYLTVLAMLCDICNKKDEYEFVDHDRRYLNAKVQFITGRPVAIPTHPESLEEIESVKIKEETIRTLENYHPEKRRHVYDIENNFISDVEVLEKVIALVNASNNLSGIIDDNEQNNIRLCIARALDVDDEFVSSLTERTFYGVESSALEFKTSIVFPPRNRRRYGSLAADPNLQKWAIIIAVCGFLNSRNGGELLLGVNDHGYAVGVQPDINELSKLNLIPFPNIDSYKNYVNVILDFAFRAWKKSNVAPKTIARDCITVVEEVDDENLTILRIKVKPYLDDVICIAAKENERPSFVEDSYFRQSGRTIPMTSKLRHQVLSYKTEG